jgi:hypothetical protein
MLFETIKIGKQSYPNCTEVHYITVMNGHEITLVQETGKP